MRFIKGKSQNGPHTYEGRAKKRVHPAAAAAGRARLSHVQGHRIAALAAASSGTPAAAAVAPPGWPGSCIGAAVAARCARGRAVAVLLQQEWSTLVRIPEFRKKG